MTLPPLLTIQYWFTLSPKPFLPWVEWILLIGFSILIVLGIAAHVVRAKSSWDKLRRRIWGKAGSALITLGLCGLLLYGFYYENISFLDLRAFYLLWLAGSAVWAWDIYRYAKVTVPAIYKKQQERAGYEKWLPKKKK